MNLELQNPFALDYPESVESSIDASASTARFNPSGLFAGHYIAVGRVDAVVSLIDFETKNVVKELEGHVKAITAICWSRNSRYLLSASRDWNIIIWDLETGDRRDTIRFDVPVTSAAFHPQNSKIIIATLQNQPEAVFVDLRSSLPDAAGRWELDIHQRGEGGEEEEEEDVVQDRKKRRRETATIARFNPRGDLVYVGTSAGNVHIFDTRTKVLLHSEKISNNASIKNMEFDTRGSSLVINSNDRAIRVFSLDQNNDLSLNLSHKFQDLINRTPWNGCAFSKDGEYVIGGAGHKAAHNVFIWDRSSGGLTKILEGPKDPLEDLDWHPIRPIIASVSNLGLIHIWVTGVAENWGAYAPGFEELDENVDYVEREDEFDIEDETEMKRRRLDLQDRHIDVSLPPTTDSHLSQQHPELFDPWAEEEPDDDFRTDFFPIPDPLDLGHGRGQGQGQGRGDGNGNGMEGGMDDSDDEQVQQGKMRNGSRKVPPDLASQVVAGMGVDYGGHGMGGLNEDVDGGGLFEGGGRRKGKAGR